MNYGKKTTKTNNITKVNSINKPKAISIFSGGLDSTVATAFYAKEYDIHTITFDYGQKSWESEIIAVKSICDIIGMKNTIIDLKWLSKIGNSALTSNKEEFDVPVDVPVLSDDDLDNIDVCQDSASKVWVPARNTIFVAIGLAFAEAEDAEIIIVGWDDEEAATFPDNSKEFLESYNATIANGSISNNITIKAPLIDLNKKEIVELGKKIGVPLDISYSCYVGEEIHCGSCESCLRRIRAFKTAKIKDETIYKDKS
ncbi:MAG: 7-cyano-7-deazaguanine synthase QueC [Methanobacteriaceae archaeon]